MLSDINSVRSYLVAAYDEIFNEAQDTEDISILEKIDVIIKEIDEYLESVAEKQNIPISEMDDEIIWKTFVDVSIDDFLKYHLPTQSISEICKIFIHDINDYIDDKTYNHVSEKDKSLIYGSMIRTLINTNLSKFRHRG